MRHPKKLHQRHHPKQPYIKIYTTQPIVDAFAELAAEQGRSASKQGEFLIKQAIATTDRDGRLVVNGS
mgnify:CR=1 FL=1